MVEIESTKSGLITVKYNGRYIHSKYDPIKEANMLIKKNRELLNDHIILLYGIGLGYHIDIIQKQLKREAEIYVFEYNIDLIKLCREINGNIFQYKNVTIFAGNDNKFYKELSKIIGKSGDIIIHRPSLETIKDDNETLYNLIDNFSLYKQSRKERDKLNRLGEENYKYNIAKDYKLVDIFINKHKNDNKPFVITSAGPSLNSDLKILKQYREKFNIISVGSSLRTLMINDIMPDCIVLLDGHDVVKKQLEGYENKTIPLCFSSRASRWAVEFYKGPKYMFNIGENDRFIIDESETVAVSAMDLAVKCDAKKIILLGQDLAYVNNKTHSDEFEKIYGIEDKITNKIRTVKSYNGGRINTAQGYIRFKYKMESLIRRNPQVEFINCSKGAFIEGAKHLNFRDVIK